MGKGTKRSRFRTRSAHPARPAWSARPRGSRARRRTTPGPTAPAPARPATGDGRASESRLKVKCLRAADDAPDLDRPPDRPRPRAPGATARRGPGHRAVSGRRPSDPRRFRELARPPRYAAHPQSSRSRSPPSLRPPRPAVPAVREPGYVQHVNQQVQAALRRNRTANEPRRGFSSPESRFGPLATQPERLKRAPAPRFHAATKQAWPSVIV